VLRISGIDEVAIEEEQGSQASLLQKKKKKKQTIERTIHKKKNWLTSESHSCLQLIHFDRSALDTERGPE